MGHINFDNLVRINKKEAIREMLKISKPSNTLREAYRHDKQTKCGFKTKEHFASQPLELIHIDLCGPMGTKGLDGELYFMLMIDDYTRMTTISFIKKKSEAYEFFKIYKELVENETDLKIKCLRSDNGREFTLKLFQQYYDENGIKRQFPTARTLQQNGDAERKTRTVEEMGRTMLKDSKLDVKFWVQAIDTTIFIINRILLRNNCNRTPYELWKGKQANVKYFRIFGSKCYIKREDQKLGKFESCVDEGIFVGYSRKRKVYKCYNLRRKQIVENVTFDEDSVLTNNDEDLESLKLETEAKKGTEKILEQEATVNQEEVNNDQQDIQAQQQDAPRKRTE